MLAMVRVKWMFVFSVCMVEKECLLQEWACFKHVKKVMTVMTRDVSLSMLYPTLSHLACIAFVLPVSTADCMQEVILDTKVNKSTEVPNARWCRKNNMLTNTFHSY